MTLVSAVEPDVTYELYRELAEELCVPVDHNLSRDVRYELYKSKLIFLRNLYEQCFREVNSRANQQNEEGHKYTGEDLRLIHNAIEATNEFLRETLLEAMRETIRTIDSHGYNSNFQVEDKTHASNY